MPTEKKSQAPGATADVAVAPAPEVDELRRTVESLRREVESLKRGAGKVQVEGIFAAPAAAGVSAPVAGVIAQYEALERALLNPVPAWVFPGSAEPATRSPAAASS